MIIFVSKTFDIFDSKLNGGKRDQLCWIINTVHPRLSEQVELKGRSDTQKIRIIEEEHFTY